MDSADPPVRTVFPDWPQYAGRIVDAVRDLTDEQLALRAAPEQMPIWALAAHTAVVRVYWLCDVLGEPGAEATPFAADLGRTGWEDDESQPRSAAELVTALETSWAIVERVLERWTVSMLDVTFERRRGDEIQVHSRASVLNRLLTHDAYHAADIGQLLGRHGLPDIDLWVRPASGT